MKPRLLAAVLLAALTPLTTLTAQQPASAGVDTTPPEIGSCHALTLDDEDAWTDRRPAVDCSSPHTSVTVAVPDLAAAPDWNDPDALLRLAVRRCYPPYIEELGGNTKSISRSAHVLYFFIPTRAQRDAGAAWIRCDAVLYGGDRLMELPDNLDLGGLPLPDARARCQKGRASGFALTVCTRSHRYRARYSLGFPYDAWPGNRTIGRDALRKCDRRIDGEFYYSYPPTRAHWNLGFRHAVCQPRD